MSTMTDIERLKALPKFLSERIIGQARVVQPFVRGLQRGELGLTNSKRPKGKYLFLGPTGVGKTELTLLACEYLYRDVDKHCIRLDMSEYQTQDTLRLLLGQNEHSTGLLGMMHRRTEGEGILLFDEIEKAHPRITDIFLQILDAGRVTVATGEILNFSKFFIVATSNIGAAQLMKVRKSDQATIERFIRTRAEAELRPEVVGRFDDVMVFNKLDYDGLLEIGDLMLRGELARMGEAGYELAADAEVVKFITGKGMSPDLGARPMRKTVEDSVQSAVGLNLLEGGAGSGRLVVDGDELKIAS